MVQFLQIFGAKKLRLVGDILSQKIRIVSDFLSLPGGRIKILCKIGFELIGSFLGLDNIFRLF
jgi:hypothetical protein